MAHSCVEMKDSTREPDVGELELAVLQTIIRQGEGYQSQIAQKLGVSSERVRRALHNLEAEGKIECWGWLNTKRVQIEDYLEGKKQHWEKSNPNPKPSWFTHTRKIFGPAPGLSAISTSGISPDYIQGYNDAMLAATLANSLRVATEKAEVP